MSGAEAVADRVGLTIACGAGVFPPHAERRKERRRLALSRVEGRKEKIRFM
jgi:hypothetical protein